MKSDSHTHSNGQNCPEDESELAVLSKTIATFQLYGSFGGSQIRSKLSALTTRSFHSSHPNHDIQERVKSRLLSHLPCLKANQTLLNEIIQKHLQELPTKEVLLAQKKVSATDYDKLVSTLRQFVRDWSEEGQVERDATYAPILSTLDKYYESGKNVPNAPFTHKEDMRVLVPGAGLGRLMFEIVRRGYSCQGNEFSFYMLLCSDYILNSITEPNSSTIYPWIHSFSNTRSEADQTRPIMIPDMCVASTMAASDSKADFSMVGGDFLEVYNQESQHGQWDVIVTCYFMDTAKDMREYMEVIQKILKPGGLWLNLGPLQYHFEGMEKESSVEYTLSEVLDLVQTYGFTLTQIRDSVPATYTSNSKGMLHYVYDNCFFTAIKE